MSEQKAYRGRLEGRVAIITGSATGIGRAFATVFAEEGADVIIADINAEEAAITERQVRAHGREAPHELKGIAPRGAVPACDLNLR